MQMETEIERMHAQEEQLKQHISRLPESTVNVTKREDVFFWSFHYD